MSRFAVVRGALILAGALLLTGLLSQVGLFQRIELWLGDAQQGLLAQEARFERTLVVDIDEESLRRLEPYLGVWPYQRDVYALVLDFLGELGARKVCFDVLTSERRPGDGALAQAVERNPDTVFAALAQSRPRQLDGEARRVLDRLSWSLPLALGVDSWADFSLPVIAEASERSGGVGVASLWPDIDGTVRRIPLFHRAQGATLPALAVAVMVAGGPRPEVGFDDRRQALRLGEHVWPIDGDGRAILNFPANARAVPSLPFHVLALAAMGATGVALNPEMVKGRTVFIGSTALQSDAVNTPRGLLPGVYLLALAHENLAGNRLLRAADSSTTVLLLLLALVVPAGWSMCCRLTPMGVGVTLLIGAGLAYANHLGLLYWWQQQSPLLFAQVAVALNGAGQFGWLALLELRRRQHAENQMRIAAAVYETSKEGFFVTDAQNRIVSINPAFSAITGYTEEDVIGRNPSMLSANQHDAEFYQTMWRAIIDRGTWQGEIWNRRKNGEVFPEWLTINTVIGDDGQVDKRIAIISDLSGNKAAEEKIIFLAHYDPLTRLPNRALLRDRVNVALAAAVRTQTCVILMLIDLDRFKNIVDSLGHSVGDQVLQEVATRLQALLGEGDTASRYGGDEFIVLLPESDAEAAAHLAERILVAIARPCQIGSHELSLSASIGIAEFPENGSDHDALSRSADSALYRAKQAGRGNFQFFAAEMHQRAQELLVLENSLRHAIARNELVLHYQPKVEAATGRLVGLEALVRWQHPEHGLISPAKFIPVAEESGQICEIGDWVLCTALEQLRAWMDAGLVPVPVAVNLSAVQFRQENLCNRLVDVLQGCDIAAELLELELTETAAMEDSAFSIASIDRVRQLGVGLSIDDFGTGYSSLAYLKRFAVGKVKIDGSFVRNLSPGSEDASIVRAIIGLAHNLGFRVVAEGVETAEQLEFLRLHGCDEIQGFYYCRPQPAADIVALLRSGTVGPAGGDAGTGSGKGCSVKVEVE